MYKVTSTNQYQKDLKRIVSNPKLVKEINVVVRLLAADDTPLPEKYKDHQLKGQFAKFRECHIRPDWLLIYKKTKKDLILLLIGTGSHSHIFK
jgi:mRNA interferase YafQ